MEEEPEGVVEVVVGITDSGGGEASDLSAEEGVLTNEKNGTEEEEPEE